MFGWLKPKEIKTIEERQEKLRKEDEERIKEATERERSRQDEGVDCLVEKVLQNIENHYDRWEGRDYGYYNDTDDIVVFEYSPRGTWRNSIIRSSRLSIEGAEFRVNHYNTEKLDDMFSKKRDEIKEARKKEVLEKWSCK